MISEKELQEAIKKMEESHGEDLEKAFVGISDKIFKHAMTPKEVFKVSEEQIENLYAEGYRLFTNGKFEKALPFFELLTLIDPEDTRFMFGLGVSLLNLKKYQEALYSFLGVTRIDEQSVEPLYHAAECSLHLGEPNTALLFLEMAINRSGEAKEWSRLKERATLMKKGIIEKVKGGGIK